MRASCGEMFKYPYLPSQLPGTIPTQMPLNWQHCVRNSVSMITCEGLAIGPGDGENKARKELCGVQFRLEFSVKEWTLDCGHWTLYTVHWKRSSSYQEWCRVDPGGTLKFFLYQSDFSKQSRQLPAGPPIAPANQIASAGQRLGGYPIFISVAYRPNHTGVTWLELILYVLFFLCS